MKTIPKLIEQDGVYFITVESDTFLDEKSVKLRVFNCPKNGDKWYLNIVIEPITNTKTNDTNKLT